MSASATAPNSVTEGGRRGLSDDPAVDEDRLIAEWNGALIVQTQGHDPAPLAGVAVSQETAFPNEIRLPGDGETETGFERRDVSVELMTIGQELYFDAHRGLCGQAGGASARLIDGIIDWQSIIGLADDLPSHLADIGETRGQDSVSCDLGRASVEGPFNGS
jgi:hypothetical protein